MNADLDSSNSRLIPLPKLLLPALTGVVLLMTFQVYWGGLHLDDWHQWDVLRGQNEVSAGASPYMEFFTFATGEREANRELIERGVLPWWTSEQLRFAFLRPVSVVTHQLDFWLWPHNPGLAHLHSVAWFLACLYAASLVYRRCGATTWGVSLAVAFFALDDAHGTTIYWLANRNHLVAGTFALFAFNEHIKWQEQNNFLAGVRAVLLFAVGLFSAELGAAFGGLVFSWALFIHRGTVVQRALSILPGAIVGVIWFGIYQHYGFGARFSGQYVDPAGDPVAFLQGILERVPLFLSVIFGIGATDLYSMGTQSMRPGLWLAAVGVTVFMTLVMVRHGRTDRYLKFWFLATIMAMLPICAGNLMDRIMLLATFAGHGLVSRFVELLAQLVTVWKRDAKVTAGRRPRLAEGLIVYFLMANLVGAPLLLWFRVYASDQHRLAIDVAADSLDDVASLANRDLIILNPPDTMFTWHLAKMRRSRDQTTPQRIRVLGSALVPLKLERTDVRTLVVRPEQPFIRSALADLYRSESLDSHWTRSLSDVQIATRGVTAEGDPTEIEYQFDSLLEDDHRVWVEWHRGRFIRFNPPLIGESQHIPAKVHPLWIAVDPLLKLLGHPTDGATSAAD